MLEQRRTCTQKAMKKIKMLKLETQQTNIFMSQFRFVSLFSGIYSSHLPTCVIVNFTKKSLNAKVIQKLATRLSDVF